MTCTEYGANVRVVRLTDKARLANHLIPGGLEAFVTTRRAAGKSWRLIAYDIYEATDKEVNVTTEALFRWFDRERYEEAIRGLGEPDGR